MDHCEDELLGWQVPNMQLEISEKITQEKKISGGQVLNKTKQILWNETVMKQRLMLKQYCIGTWNVRSMDQKQAGSGQTGDETKVDLQTF